MARIPLSGGAFSPAADYDIAGDWHFTIPPRLGSPASPLVSGALEIVNEAADIDDVLASFETTAPLVQIRPAQTLTDSGNQVGRGTIRLIDLVDSRTMEIGFYEFGMGIFGDQLFEMWSEIVSFRSFSNLGTRLQVRNPDDTSALELWDNGTIARITTHEGVPSEIRIEAGAVLQACFKQSGRTIIASATDDGVNILQVNGTLGFQNATSPATVLDGTVNGDLLVRNVNGNAGAVKLGTATAASPMIKRSSADLHVKLADDSAFADVVANNITARGVMVVGTAAAASGSIRLNDGAIIHSAGALTLKGTLAGGLKLDTLVPPAGSGQRYLQIDANGVVTSSASAPVGT